jgi:hypothetical protein
MTRVSLLTHEFVEYIPQDLKDGTIYVSIPFATAAHRCCCGCGSEVVTPLSPTDWRLTFDGETISLEPSIGNWSFGCQSHYWIRRNQVKWAPRWSEREIQAGRAEDRSAKEQQFNERPLVDAAKSPEAKSEGRWLARLWTRLLRRRQ